MSSATDRISIEEYLQGRRLPKRVGPYYIYPGSIFDTQTTCETWNQIEKEWANKRTEFATKILGFLEGSQSIASDFSKEDTDPMPEKLLKCAQFTPRSTVNSSESPSEHDKASKRDHMLTTLFRRANALTWELSKLYGRTNKVYTLAKRTISYSVQTCEDYKQVKDNRDEWSDQILTINLEIILDTLPQILSSARIGVPDLLQCVSEFIPPLTASCQKVQSSMNNIHAGFAVMQDTINALRAEVVEYERVKSQTSKR